jgi:membrane-bound lytic murein transglycosylase MltF
MTILVFFFFFPAGHAIENEDALLTEKTLKETNRPFFGDFDEMVQKRTIRVLMPYNRIFFFFDGAQPKGISYELVMQFEKFINESLQTGTLKVSVIVIPTPRQELFSRLLEGRGDIAVGNLTITDERRKTVDFSDPLVTNINEILVTHRRQPELTNLSDISKITLHVRESSSYYQHLKNLDIKTTLIEAPEYLEDADLLEMVQTQLIPAIIIDEHKGRLWQQVFDNIRLHPDVIIHGNGESGWAFRKNSPRLKKIVNSFVKENRAGTLFGNILINRYLKNADYITHSTSGRELAKLTSTIEYFEKYANRYTFDTLMLAALAYQESRLDQSLRSQAGAIGVMQLLPSTARDKNIGIKEIEKIEPNIHAGTKYLRFMADRYFTDEHGMDPLNRILFTFAAYNAGPGKITQLRKEADQMALDPNIWFQNVEIVAAKRIGRETVQYVSNIMKYYTAYKLLEDEFLLQTR